MTVQPSLLRLRPKLGRGLGSSSGGRGACLAAGCTFLESVQLLVAAVPDGVGLGDAVVSTIAAPSLPFEINLDLRGLGSAGQI